MIYVVYDDCPYEGCSEPLAAFSTRPLADAYAAKMQITAWGRTKYLVIELPIDKEPKP